MKCLLLWGEGIKKQTWHVFPFALGFQFSFWGNFTFMDVDTYTCLRVPLDLTTVRESSIVMWYIKV